MKGGIDNPDEDNVIKEDDGKTFFYQKFYDPELGRFEDPPSVEKKCSTEDFCVSCHRAEERRALMDKSLLEPVEVSHLGAFIFSMVLLLW